MKNKDKDGIQVCFFGECKVGIGNERKQTNLFIDLMREKKRKFIEKPIENSYEIDLNLCAHFFNSTTSLKVYSQKWSI